MGHRPGRRARVPVHRLRARAARLLGPQPTRRHYPRRIEPGDDDALVTAARDGDRAALERLLRAHQPRIHALCRRLLGSPADAEDATQDALLAVVRGLPRFDGRSAFSTWVHRVTTNVCLDELRRRSRRPVTALRRGDDGGPEPVEVVDPTPGPGETVAERLPIDAALAALSETYRAPVVLRDVLGLDYAEIGEVLQIPPGTVRSRIARGRARLAELLAEPDEPRNPDAAPVVEGRRP